MSESSARARIRSLLLVLGVAAAALLPDLNASLPLNAYYFRDFTLTFYPLRQFQAMELLQGRLPFWNPYVHEGEFMLLSFYPLDLLHVLDPSPAFVSWLLNLHLPLAAVAAYALARARGMSGTAAFACGSVYALGGFALATLNLYSFLQALALAPLVLLTFERAATRGGRWVVAAALALALSLSTLVVELIAQAVALAAVLALLRDAPTGPRTEAMRYGLPRVFAALVLGTGLAAVPIALTLGMIPETVRGSGFITEEAGGLALPPVVLLQAILPSLYGSLARPFEAWWGGTLFPDGPPYFISIYLGVLVLAAAASGAASAPRRERYVLLAAAVLGTWYALGPAGGLWNLLSDLPFARAFRTPSKTLFIAHLALALLAGRGIDALRVGRHWRTFGAIACAGALVLAALAAGAWLASDPVGEWLRLDARAREEFGAVFAPDAARTAIVATLGLALALATLARKIRAPLAAGLLVAVLVLDLARAGIGVNRQAPPMFYELLPEIAAERLDRLEGGRVFVYPAINTRSFLAWLDARTAAADLWAFYANRQQLDPYNNVMDRVETAASGDRTRFSPLLTELGWTGYDPRNIGQILPYLRDAAVSRVLSFDPLTHSDLRLRKAVPVALTGLAVHVYEVSAPWPRAFVACRVLPAETRMQAARIPHGVAFDPRLDVALEIARDAHATGCRSATVRALSHSSDEERFEVQSDGPGWFVERSTHARGWHATLDGQPVALERADGRHRAVPVPAGRHEVVLRYAPPWLWPGVALMAASVLVLLWLWRRKPK